MENQTVQHEREPRTTKERKPLAQNTNPPTTSQPPVKVKISEPVKPSISRVAPLTPPLTPKQMQLVTSANELYTISLRILYEVITWARNVPTFTSLPFSDQTLLLERSWSDMFLLGLARWNIPVEIDIMIELGCQKKSDEPVEVTEDFISDLLRLKTIVQIFNVMKLDSIEYSCIKAIILFKPDMRGIDASTHIANLQDQAQVMLQDYTRTRGPRARFGRVLLKIPLLSEVSPSLVEKSFFKGKLEDINEDLWKRNTFPLETQEEVKTESDVEKEESKVDVEF